LWYRTVQAHFETWLALAAESEATAPPAYVKQAFRRYRDYGVLAPNAPLRAAVTALAPLPVAAPAAGSGTTTSIVVLTKRSECRAAGGYPDRVTCPQGGRVAAA
jgi:hypothetical protein